MSITQCEVMKCADANEIVMIRQPRNRDVLVIILFIFVPPGMTMTMTMTKSFIRHNTIQQKYNKSIFTMARKIIRYYKTNQS